MNNLQLLSHVMIKDLMLSSQDQKQDKMATLTTSNQQCTVQLKSQEVRTLESEALGPCQIMNCFLLCLSYKRKVK